MDPNRVGLCPVRVLAGLFLPFSVVFCRSVKKQFLPSLTGLYGILHPVVGAQIIGLFLENDLCHIFSPDEIDAPVSGSIVPGGFSAFQQVQGSTVHMGQIGMEFFPVFVSAAAAALQIGVLELVAGSHVFLSAVASAAPDDIALRIPQLGGFQGSEAAEFLSGQVFFSSHRYSIVGKQPI